MRVEILSLLSNHLTWRTVWSSVAPIESSSETPYFAIKTTDIHCKLPRGAEEARSCIKCVLHHPARTERYSSQVLVALTGGVTNFNMAMIGLALEAQTPSLKTMKAAMRLVQKEVTIDAPWGKIRGLSWGTEGAPGVLLCHGKLDACSGFRPLVQLLPERFHYFAFDLPGNGRSDHLPPGTLQTTMDFVPAIRLVREYLKWDKFIFVGHSLGVVLGKFFNMAYPGHITRMVEIDPVPAYDNYNPDPEAIKGWYHHFYHTYYVDWYTKLNNGGQAPKYTYEKALDMMMKNRDLHKEAAECVLERAITPTGDGFYRFTHDQRMKRVTRLPLSGDALRAIYTSSHTPTFCVLAQNSLDSGDYDRTSFIKDAKLWPNGNYSFKIVEGGHDVHISHPERMSEEISSFLLKDFNSKL